jgi:hypothetical protein
MGPTIGAPDCDGCKTETYERNHLPSETPDRMSPVNIFACYELISSGGLSGRG